MPRIRRWFHVSHDINEDPEVWELTDTFGDWLLRVWLQMLSIGDRHGSLIKGDRSFIEQRLARLWSSNSRRYNAVWRQNRVRMALEWMSDKGWIRFEKEGIVIVNQLKYLSRRVQQKHLRESITSSPPSLPSSPAPITPIDLHLAEVLSQTEYLKPLGNGRHGRFWKVLEQAYDEYPWLYFEEEIKKADAWIAANPGRKPTDRGLPRFMRNWFEKAVEYGRKTRGKEKA